MIWHVMVDVESLGEGPCAIGAVLFDPMQRTLGILPGLDRFHARISRASLAEAGFRENPATLLWWDRQSPEAQEETRGDEPLGVALLRFSEWLPRDPIMWAYPPSYDFGAILHPAYAAMGARAPWSRKNERDARTIIKATGVPRPPESEGGVRHRSIDDAVYQALWVQAAFAVLP